jgi:hypothetical protein
MKKIEIISIGLLMLMVTALGLASATEGTFADDYMDSYIEMFGNDRVTLKNTPIDGERYTSTYKDLFGEDRLTLKNPTEAYDYQSGYIEMFGIDRYILHENAVPDDIDTQPVPTPTPNPPHVPVRYPEGFWEGVIDNGFPEWTIPTLTVRFR